MTLKQVSDERLRIEGAHDNAKKEYAEKSKVYYDRLKDLQSKCPHKWERYSGYDGVSYDCYICGASK